MFSKTALLESDLWEIWIEYNELDRKNFGVLYVIGEVMTDRDAEGPCIRRTSGRRSSELVLQVPTVRPGRKKRKEVLYSEPVSCLGQYQAVSIYSSDRLLASFRDIEVLI